MADQDVQLGDMLCFAIYAAGHAFNRVYQPMLQELGVTYPQYLVLTALWSEDGQTVGNIGNRLFLESNTLTPLLKRLEAAGHVLRRRDTVDERLVRIELTPQGRALRSQAREIPGCIIAAGGGDADWLQQLKCDLDRLRESLDSFSAA